MLYTVKSPRRRAFPTDCAREAFEEAMRHGKASVVVDEECLARRMDSRPVLRDLREDGRQRSKQRRKRFRFACWLISLSSRYEAGENKRYLKWFDSLPAPAKPESRFRSFMPVSF